MAVIFAATLTACNDDAPPEGVVEPTDAYTAIITWQAAEQEPVIADNGEEQLPVIFVVAASGDKIDVGVQAAVTEATSDAAVVRFADESNDGFDDDLEGAPVRDHGVMLAIGAIPQPSHSVDVDVDRYTTQDDPEPLTLTITAQDATAPTVDGVKATRATVTLATRR